VTRRLLGGLLLTLLLPWPAAAQGAPAPAPAPTPDVSDAQRLMGAPRGRALRGADLDAETKRVGALLRCPVCQGLSVADSPATMAVNMRHQVQELLAAGYTGDQILAYFERAYGEFVRLEPPLRGVNWTLWLAPAAFLLLGGGFILWFVRRGASSGATEAQAAASAEAVGDPLPGDPELAAYVLRVREMAYGWPGGVRPGPEK
jgi:cytochrome c-type biogenesis protein CcmH